MFLFSSLLHLLLFDKTIIGIHGLFFYHSHYLYEKICWIFINRLIFCLSSVGCSLLCIIWIGVNGCTGIIRICSCTVYFMYMYLYYFFRHLLHLTCTSARSSVEKITNFPDCLESKRKVSLCYKDINNVILGDVTRA